jgi:hypothetical protein
MNFLNRHSDMFRTGDVVEVRSREEILGMLQTDGRLPRDRLPFMPEMLQYCGRRFRVSSVAHKTCDTATLIMGRRMRDTVFLEDLRCDGSAHGGCQARCLLFWRTQWLKPADESSSARPATQRTQLPVIGAKCSECRLHDATRSVTPDGEIRYSCQATEHWAASEPLRPLAVWHFVADVRSRNARIRDVVRVVGLHLVWRLRDLKRGWRMSTALYAALHRLSTKRPDPFRVGAISDGMPTPDETLDLQPGELVEVKSHDEILQTVSIDLKNRGLKYNAEMTPACGQKHRVAQRVTQIIDEYTGRMITMKKPCITLEGVYCQSQYTCYSLLCSRRVTPYFREIWLRRVQAGRSASEEAVTSDSGEIAARELEHQV